jgi:uncharacterized repeat protein (TIGR03803 family)
MRSKRPFSAGKPTLMVFVMLVLASAILPTQAQARKFKVLHTFHGRDGANPISQLIRDKAGNFYGVTVLGGAGKCQSGCGTAFKMDKTGKMIWMHSFNGHDGFEPYAGLLLDKTGNLYGTTVFGGMVNSNICALGCGVIFRLSSTGKEIVLHKFTGPPDGYSPQAPLVARGGLLYGTADIGGAHGYGVVFQVTKAGKESVLHSFEGSPDGAIAYGGVIVNAAGDLFGDTFDGGDGMACNFGCGTIFEVDSTGKETILYNFDSFDGAHPVSVLIADSAGNLYGTTTDGGNGNCGGTGCGTVFELSPHSDGSWTERVLYAFCSLSNCGDGEVPFGGPLVRDATGNLYGITNTGGTSRCNGSGCGVVFKLDPSGQETVLHSFTGGADGKFPSGGLVLDDAGNLYGAALQGGARGNGVVFGLTP